MVIKLRAGPLILPIFPSLRFVLYSYGIRKRGSMAEAKGFAIRGLLRFIKESGYPGGIPAVLSVLPPEDQVHFKNPINASAWYPYSVFAHLLHAIDQKLGKGVEKRIGEASAAADIQGVFKIISAIAGFSTLLPRARLFWPRYFSPGKLVALQEKGRADRLQIQDFPEMDPLHCVVLEGWFEQIAKLFKAKNVRVTHSACVHMGDSCCEYTLEYD
jgi:hypothetical protein